LLKQGIYPIKWRFGRGDAERRLLKAQEGSERQWGIRQKQTGADSFTLSGTLSANAHGRGLTFKPIVSDTESIEIINAAGETIICSREENNELFHSS